MVTRCSCIASRSADCVFGGVRLISSARTMFAKIGPGANTICRRPVVVSSLMMSVPVMSDGMRSGVNWMRLNFRSSTFASVATSSVFASPGTPTMRLLPPTKSVSSTSSMTSDWPMIRLPSSSMICCRPCFILSASAISSTEDSVVICVASVAESIGPSVCECVDDVIYSELVRLVRFVDRFQSRVGKLPVLRDVRVEVRHRDQALVRIVVLEDAAEDRRAQVVILRHVKRLHFEKSVIHLRRQVEIEPAVLGQHPRHLQGEVFPPAAARGEVVENHETALQQVLAERRRFLVGHVPEAGLAHVSDRLAHQFRVVERHDVAVVQVRIQEADLVHDLHEV